MDHPTEIIGNEKRVLARLLGGAYDTEDEGDWIGPYRLIARLGEGGFGIVWRAEQTDPVQREVALKVIKRGMDTAQVLARFDHERQALATMEHPCIAAMLDAGANVDGRPYFAMELVAGEALTHWCERHRSPIHERLRLFNMVCYAVNHAHQKGVIHRDLKPSNILVTSVDALPTPKIIDFGIAKAIRATTLSELTMLTQADQVVGTPLYMSPEQIDGGQMIDTRSDIYALGVLLYELLTGVPPFEAEGSGSRTLDALKRSIREDRPAHPGTLVKARHRLEGDAPAISPPYDSTMPNYSVDLDWIVMHALEKNPAQRYQTAMELAEDVSRFLAKEPIHARPPKFGYITGRWIQRHRTMFVAACAVVLAMIAGTVVSLWQARIARAAQAHAEAQTALAVAAETRATKNEALARTEAARAQHSAAFLTDLLDRVSGEIDNGRNPEALKLALADSEKRIEALGADTELQLQLLNRVAEIYKRIGETKQMIPLLKAAANTSAKLNGPTSDAAFRAELEYLKMVTDHGNRITAPALIEDLRRRVDTNHGRGTKFWFDVQRQLVRAYTKLKQSKPAVAAADECLAEMSKRKGSTKVRLSYIIACVEAFEIHGDFQRANALLAECVKLNEDEQDEHAAEQILKQRVHVCWSQRDFAGGASLLRQLVAGLKKKHGDQSPEILGKLIELAEYEIDAREFDSAFAHAQEALAIARTEPGKREDLSLALICLAKANAYKLRYDDAIARANEAREIAQELGKTSTIHRCTEMLAVLHEDAGHLEEAASYYQLYQQHIEAEHANYKETLEVMEEVCSIRVKQGRTDEAMKLAQELWSRLQAEPASKSEPGFTAEIANQCLVAYKAWRTANPTSPDPEHLAEWKGASVAAKPTESIFSRLNKRQL